MQSLSKRKDIVCTVSFLFYVYNESNTDLCLHRRLYLTKIHHQAFLFGDQVKDLRREVAYGGILEVTVQHKNIMRDLWKECDSNRKSHPAIR